MFTFNFMPGLFEDAVLDVTEGGVERAMGDEAKSKILLFCKKLIQNQMITHMSCQINA